MTGVCGPAEAHQIPGQEEKSSQPSLPSSTSFLRTCHPALSAAIACQRRVTRYAKLGDWSYRMPKRDNSGEIKGPVRGEVRRWLGKRISHLPEPFLPGIHLCETVHENNWIDMHGSFMQKTREPKGLHACQLTSFYVSGLGASNLHTP